MPGKLDSVLAKHDIELSPDELAHYGKKGMKWGVRKGESNSSSGSAEKPAPKPKAKDLSDDELKTHIARMKLEKEYNTLSAKQVNKGRQIVGNLLLDVGKKQAADYLNREIAKALTKKVVEETAKAATSAAAKGAAKAATSAASQVLVGRVIN